MVDERAIIGFCHYEACFECIHGNGIGGCTRVLSPAKEVYGEDLYCTEFKPDE